MLDSPVASLLNVPEPRTLIAAVLSCSQKIVGNNPTSDIMVHSGEKIRHGIFAIGLAVEACVFVAIGSEVLKEIRASKAELPLLTYPLLIGVGLALLIHHIFIYKSFGLFETYQTKAADLSKIIGCSATWLGNRFHRWICFIVALLFAGLTGEIPYIVVVLSQLPLANVEGLSKWLVEHHGTTEIFIWVSIVITGLLVIWSLIGWIITQLEARRTAAPTPASAPFPGVCFSYLALWLFSDFLACLNWIFVLRFMFYEGKQGVGVLTTTAVIYCVTILMRCIFAPRFPQPTTTPQPA